MGTLPKETASNKVINTLARQIRSEMSEMKEQVTALDKKIDDRLESIDENLAEHMQRTAILENCREKDAFITQENTKVIERILPVLARYEAAETAAKWLYKPAFLLLIAFIAYMAGAQGSAVLEILKKMVGI